MVTNNDCNKYEENQGEKLQLWGFGHLPMNEKRLLKQIDDDPSSNEVDSNSFKNLSKEMEDDKDHEMMDLPIHSRRNEDLRDDGLEIIV